MTNRQARLAIRGTLASLATIAAIGFGILNDLVPCAACSAIAGGYLVGALHD